MTPVTTEPDIDARVVHRLGVFAELGSSRSTRAWKATAKVDHWKNSEQTQRWLATALLDLEPRLRRIKNYRALPPLREAIERQMHGVKKVGGVNSGSLTEFQLRMALIQRPTRRRHQGDLLSFSPHLSYCRSAACGAQVDG